MKKLLSLILVMAMVLSLCACGKADDYEAAVTLMEAGNYEEAIAAFTELGDYEDSASKKLECENAIAYNEAISLIETRKYEEARLIFETISDYKDVSDYLDRYKTIEITPENWGEYFEIILVPYFDTFDRLEEISYKFVFKNEYKDTVVYGSGFSIDIAYKCTGTTASVEYDKQTDSFTFGPELPGWGGQCFYDQIFTFKDADFAKMSVGRENLINNKETRGICNLVIDGIYHEAEGDACQTMEHKIENIKGTIVLFCND